MRKRPYKHIVLLSGIALLGIVLLQISGTHTTLRLKRQYMKEHFQMSLHNLTHRVCVDALLNDVEALETTINHTLEDHFSEGYDEKSYQLAILAEDDSRILYSNQTDDIQLIKRFTFKENGFCKYSQQNVTFYLNIPDINQRISTSLVLWTIFSLLLTGVVIYSFYYVVSSSSRQYKLSQIKNDFINNMSHELKTPVATMSVASEMLIKDEIISDKDRSTRYARIIRDESQRLRNLVDKVLNIAIFEKQQPGFKYQPTDVHELIHEIIQPFQLIIEKEKGQLTIELAASNSIVNGDAEHLTQTLTNLIDNAIKYSPEELWVNISTRNSEHCICIEVEDRGMGIDKKEKERIFEKFHRIGNGDIHDIKGFGIGLYYVKRVVEHHKGKLEVNSNGKKGSRFSIYIPTKDSI